MPQCYFCETDFPAEELADAETPKPKCACCNAFMAGLRAVAQEHFQWLVPVDAKAQSIATSCNLVSLAGVFCRSAKHSSPTVAAALAFEILHGVVMECLGQVDYELAMSYARGLKGEAPRPIEGDRRPADILSYNQRAAVLKHFGLSEVL